MILCLSASHKKANVPMLEALAFKDTKVAASSFAKIDCVQEIALLGTCNRIEIYAVGPGIPEHLAERLIQHWSRASNVSTDIIVKTIEVFTDREALLHLLRVASGLESMVIGENEILGQVRRAYVESKENGTIGPILEKAFTKAFNVGKRVRATTQINKGLTSLSSVAVQMVQEHGFPEHREIKTLLLGAGEAGTLVAEELNKKGNFKTLIANRTFSKGKKLADRIGATAIPFDEVPRHLSSMDLVITATNSEKPLLRAEHLQRRLQKKGKTKMLIIDLSQPRCVEGRVARLSSVELKNIDDIKNVVRRTIKIREKERRLAERIIDEELNHLQMQISETIVQPVIAKLCAAMEEVRRKEFIYAKNKLKSIDDEELQIVENLTKVLTRRLLQPAIEKLKRSSLNSDSALLGTTKELFNLEQQQNQCGKSTIKEKNNEPI